MSEEKLKPKIEIIHGDKETGIHIYQEQGGVLHGDAHSYGMQETVDVLNAVIAELTDYRDKLQEILDLVLPESENHNN